MEGRGVCSFSSKENLEKDNCGSCAKTLSTTNCVPTYFTLFVLVVVGTLSEDLVRMKLKTKKKTGRLTRQNENSEEAFDKVRKKGLKINISLSLSVSSQMNKVEWALLLVEGNLQLLDMRLIN